MKRFRYILLFILISCTIVTFGQTTCDTLSPILTKQFDGYSQKKFNKLKNKKDLKPQIAFDIATYFRLKADTSYKQWYALYIDLLKKMFTHKYQDKRSRADLIFYTAEAYYFTDNYVQANSWFIKTIKSSYSNSCVDYYYTQTKDKLTKIQDRQFYLYYGVSGLGSNMGSLQPTIRVRGTKFIYTSEQNSYFEKKTMSPDTISSGTLRQSSVDSIINLVKDLKDTTIFESNPCMMSGAIYYMTVVVGTDSTNYELMNTFDRNALKIVAIINPYLPSGKKIWADEEMIKHTEDCWEHLKKRLEDAKKDKNKQ